MPKNNRRRRVPEVLRRVYGPHVQPIVDAILFLLPSPPNPPVADCPYSGAERCLFCAGPGERRSFLLRPDDPADYRLLLTEGFAVVSDGVPLLGADFDPRPRSDQRSIVQYHIEALLRSSRSSDLICDGYDRCVGSSSILDDLSRPAWHLLLTRIGDRIMVHFLRFSTIFLLLPSKTYYQVSGFPLHKSLLKVKKPKDKTSVERKFSFPEAPIDGPKKKRRAESMEKLHVNPTLVQKMPVLEENMENSSPTDLHTVTRKRLRPYSWQRHRQQKKMNMVTSNAALQEYDKSVPDSLDNSSELLTYSISHSGLPKDQSGQKLSRQESNKTQSPCLFFSMLQESAQTFSKRSQVGRQSMFYNATSSRSVFSKNPLDILSRVKPNDKGAIAVMKSILRGSISCSLSSCKIKKICSNKAQCICKSLLKLIKSLIKNVRRCQCLRILSKHCSVSFLTPEDGDNSSTSKRHEMRMDLPLFHLLKLRRNHYGMVQNISWPGQKSFSQVKQGKEEHTLGNDVSGSNLGDLSRSHCSNAQVVSFIWAICRSIVPQDLLGSPSNWRTLRKRISDFVQLRRFEKFNLKQCMYGLKTLNVPFLSEFTNLDFLFNHDIQITLRAMFFEKWMFWFFSFLVVPLVAAHFYVTETESGGQNVSYYRKSFWQRSTNKTIRILCEQSYRLLDPEWLRNPLRKRTFGFSKIRFLPKENGLRPLANLKAPSCVLLSGGKVYLKRKFMNVKYSKNLQVRNYRSVNSNLRDLHVILKRIKVEQPEMLGSSVFDYNDIYKKLGPYIIDVRRQFMTMPDIFIVVCDVLKAFDNINQDKLLQLMDGVLQRNEYSLQRYAQIFCTKESVRVHFGQMSVDSGNNSSTTKYKALLASHSSPCVIVDQFRCKHIEKAQVLRLLCEHVKGNLVQLGQSLYLQCVGISQGSILSSLLCSYYYAHLEKSLIFPWLEKNKESSNLPSDSLGFDQEVSSLPKSLVLRLIDDFLFISTSRRQACNFYSRLQRGFREYNCKMNRKKFCMNFDMGECSGRLRENRVYTGQDGVSFIPWSGLLINCQTLEIQADYTRYWISNMSSRITVSNKVKPCCQLKMKLCDYMRPKCHPIFYDSNINSPRTVRLNAYQAFLLCAMKFHCFLCALPKACGRNPVYLLEIIERSMSYMFQLINKRMHSMKCMSNLRPVLNLKRNELCYLGLAAYLRILGKKQSRHLELLKLLRSQINKYSHQISANDDVGYAVDDCHSSMFWKIKF